MDEKTSVIIGILSSLFASIIFYFSVHIFKRLFSFLINKYIRLNKKISEKFIKRIASRNINYIFDLGYALIIIIVFVIFIGFNVIEKVDFRINLFPPTFQEIFAIVWAIIVVLYFTSRFATYYKIQKEIIDFENELRIIRPKVKQEEIFILEREWLLMKTFDDLFKIYETINNIKKDINKKNKI